MTYIPDTKLTNWAFWPAAHYRFSKNGYGFSLAFDEPSPWAFFDDQEQRARYEKWLQEENIGPAERDEIEALAGERRSRALQSLRHALIALRDIGIATDGHLPWRKMKGLVEQVDEDQ
jgi:hypothetical protein